MMLIRRRWLAALALLLIIAALAPGLRTALVPDNALTVWFLETDPKLQEYRRFQEHFGNDEVILLLVHEPDGIFRARALERIRRLIHALETVDGVARVHSLFSVHTPELRDDGGPVLVPTVPATLPADLGAVREAVLADPLARSRFVSADGTSVMLWIEMDLMEDIDLRRDSIVTSVVQISDETLTDVDHALGGVGVIYSGLNLLTQRDFVVFVGVGYLLMFAALWWVFRRGLLVLAAMAVIVLGTVGALGLYGLLGHQVNMVTMVLPTLIIVLGIADAVHFPTAFLHEARVGQARSRMEIVTAALRRTLTAFPTMLI